MDKEDVVLLYSITEKNEMMSFTATWVDQKIIILSEISQIENDRYCMTLLICEVFLKNDTVELVYKMETDSQS